MPARYDPDIPNEQIVAKVTLEDIGETAFQETRDWTYLNGAGSYRVTKWVDGMTGPTTMIFAFTDLDTAFWFKVRFR